MAIDSKLYTEKVSANLTSDKDFKVFFYRFMINGKQYKGLINLSDRTMWNKRDRISFAQSELVNIQKKKKDNIHDNIILNKMMEKHFEFIKDGAWKKTKMSHYERYIKPYIGKKTLSSIRQFDIKTTIKKQEELALAPRTIKQTLEVLSPAFKEAIANRLLNFNPCDGIIIKLPKTKKIVANATDELISIYKVIVKVFKDDSFFLAFFLFALQGRRKGEILKLQWKDIAFEHNYYILRNTKNGETQKMYLPENIKLALIDFYEPTNIYVFSSAIKEDKHIVKIATQVTKIKQALNNQKFGVHYLRNVITSAMGEQGIEAIYQSGALGHNDLTTINKYSSLNYLKGSKIASGIIDRLISHPYA